MLSVYQTSMAPKATPLWDYFSHCSVQQLLEEHFPGEGGGHQAQQWGHDRPPAEGQLQEVQGVQGS